MKKKRDLKRLALISIILGKSETLYRFHMARNLIESNTQTNEVYHFIFEQHRISHLNIKIHLLLCSEELYFLNIRELHKPLEKILTNSYCLPSGIVTALTYSISLYEGSRLV